MALARSENSPQRFYSMSSQIRQERKAYYDILKETQKGTMEITAWMEWFLGCLGRAIDGAQTTLSAVLAKARFWERLQGVSLKDRQRLILNRLLDGFEGKLTTSKYAILAKCPQHTALRDILALVARSVLAQNAARGRSTSYTMLRLRAQKEPVREGGNSLSDFRGSEADWVCRCGQSAPSLSRGRKTSDPYRALQTRSFATSRLPRS